MENETKKKEKVYTEKETAFLNAMRDPANLGKISKCMDIAGYSESHRPHIIVKQLGEELIQIAKEMMAAHSVQASLAIAGVLTNSETLGAQHIIKAAESILDRAGVVKQSSDVELKVPAGGLFILPAKKKPVDDDGNLSD